MSSAREIALDLLKRLLAGEREDVPLHLSMLLEKSSSLADSDENYRRILPPELADLRLSPETRDEIVATLCAEIARDPDANLISVASSTGAELATKTIVKILANPPRLLTMAEYANALSLASEYLPYELCKDPGFLSKADLERLVQVTKELSKVEEAGSDREDRAARLMVRHHAAGLLRRLAGLGIGADEQ